MSCSSSSSVSLLQLQRPITRSRSLRRRTDAGVRDGTAEAKEAATLGPITSSVDSITPSDRSHDYSETRTCSSPIPSSSSGMNYLNVDPTCSMSEDRAECELARQPSELQSTFVSLRSVAAGALGQALPRSQWQPDSDSSLCSVRFCSTIFGPPSYFTLGPRRHHCRLCGLLFCHDHSRTRAPVSTVDKSGAVVIFRARVCDNCVEQKTADLALSRTASAETGSSHPSEILVTPNGEYGTLSEPTSFPRRSSGPEAEITIPPSPPVEAWMGRDAVLSLYPLAANSSRSCFKLNPSAPPLFAPSPLERQAARDKENARLTLRQRRLGSELNFLLPNHGEADSDDEEIAANRTVLVQDGPICYRTKAGRCPARVMSRTDMSAIYS